MEEQGIVRQVRGPHADVVVRRGAECASGCQAGGCSCGNLNLFDSGTPREIVVKSRNTAGAHEGDLVVLSLSDGAFVKGSFIAYIVPILLLFAGAGLGSTIAAALGLDLSGDAAAALFGSLFFLLSFVGIALYTRNGRSGEQYVPEIVRVIGRAPCAEGNGFCSVGKESAGPA